MNKSYDYYDKMGKKMTIIIQFLHLYSSCVCHRFRLQTKVPLFSSVVLCSAETVNKILLSHSPQHRLTPSDEDFIIDVLPGTYAVTASVQESQQQTQVVTVKPGESFHLTFNL